ncbi:MAG: hypothetical protein M3458_11950 [Acidobacteriota bacterium]|nr:hypothetical protein [Acidobacteriota bacterium]
MPNIKIEINEYLSYEFDLSDEEADEQSALSEVWPFKLDLLGHVETSRGITEIFVFSNDGESFFAIADHSLNYYPQAGMTIDDLRCQVLGTEWIGTRDSVDLDTSHIGDEHVPSVIDRRAAITKLATDALGAQDEMRVLEGLYLTKVQKYLALVQIGGATEAVIIGDEVGPQYVGFTGASAWRRLAVGVGVLLLNGKLVGGRPSA